MQLENLERLNKFALAEEVKKIALAKFRKESRRKVEGAKVEALLLEEDEYDVER